MKILNYYFKTSKRFLMILFVFGLFSSPSFGQKKGSTRNSSTFEGAKSVFFVELLGNGLLFSANFDTRVVNNFGIRVGAGYVGATESNGGGILTVPVMGNVLLGKNGSYFEVGAGATYVSGTGSLFDIGSSVVGTLSFMYRKQPVDGGFMWKIGLTPFIASGVFIPYWGGVGIGYCW